MSKIEKFEGFETKPATVREKLPANAAYVAKIIGTKVDENSRIVFQVEITEGKYAGFYKRDYDAQEGGKYPQKYRGMIRVQIPNDHSPSWALARFNGTMSAIESSNRGYRWDWETNSLKDKTVGIVTRESEYNGNVYTEIGMFIDAERARNGDFKPMKRRGGDSKPSAPVQVQSAWDEDDSELPF